jgi:hypothetical protein
MKLVNLVGKRFGRLKVISEDGDRSGGQVRWICQCDCGSIKVIRGALLKNGSTKSCSCLQTESRKAAKTTHGLRYSDEYRIWRHMRTRCENKNSPAFRDYGGRGIFVCDRWMIFANFYNDMGARPSANHSIDRIDNSKGYFLQNCRWATMKEQQRNRRDTKTVFLDGVSASLAEHCENKELKYATVHKRIVSGANMPMAFTKGRLARGSIQRLLKGENHV